MTDLDVVLKTHPSVDSRAHQSIVLHIYEIHAGLKRSVSRTDSVMIVVLMWIPLTTHSELQNQDGIPMVPIEDLEGKPVVPTERFSLSW